MQLNRHCVPVIGAMLLFSIATLYFMYSGRYQTGYVLEESLQGKYQERPHRSGNTTDSHSTQVQLSEDNFMQSQRELQEKRRRQIAETCSRYPQPRRDVAKQPPFNIIVDHDHKIMYCFVPKVACTSWKRVFLVLKGVIDEPEEVDQFQVNHVLQKRLDFFSHQSATMRRHILSRYTKFMVARDPFSRVLSAYKNKLAPDTTFERAGRWQNKLGRMIIERFHDDQTSRNRAKDDDQNEYDLTFTDFVRYLSASEAMDKQDNRHWKELYKFCLPCDIQYDIISKFETMSNDVEFIMRSVGLKGAIDFPTSNSSSPTNSTNELLSYYDQVPDEYVRMLYDRYKLDFELFGYDKPSTIRIS